MVWAFWIFWEGFPWRASGPKSRHNLPNRPLPPWVLQTTCASEGWRFGVALSACGLWRGSWKYSICSYHADDSVGWEIWRINQLRAGESRPFLEGPVILVSTGWPRFVNHQRTKNLMFTKHNSNKSLNGPCFLNPWNSESNHEVEQVGNQWRCVKKLVYLYVSILPRLVGKICSQIKCCLQRVNRLTL